MSRFSKLVKGKGKPQLSESLNGFIVSLCTLPQLQKAQLPLLRPNNLQLCRTMHEVVSICLRNKFPLVRLLDKVFVTLFLRKPDGIFLCLESDFLALHKVCTGLPSHQRVLPSVSLG